MDKALKSSNMMVALILDSLHKSSRTHIGLRSFGSF
jgi:hypothetical protein